MISSSIVCRLMRLMWCLPMANGIDVKIEINSRPDFDHDDKLPTLRTTDAAQWMVCVKMWTNKDKHKDLLSGPLCPPLDDVLRLFSSSTD